MRMEGVALLNYLPKKKKDSDTRQFSSRAHPFAFDACCANTTPARAVSHSRYKQTSACKDSIFAPRQTFPAQNRSVLDDKQPLNRSPRHVIGTSAADTRKRSCALCRMGIRRESHAAETRKHADFTTRRKAGKKCKTLRHRIRLSDPRQSVRTVR
mmetsp:Transcript_11813/g.31778  ORF Transcript_11813/g.31778 Transcript_11813/m.31778 type:complete len:155 (-) Transcript_11813:577-1041(-)